MNEIGSVRGKEFVKRLILAELLVRRGEEGPLARPRPRRRESAKIPQRP